MLNIELGRLTELAKVAMKRGAPFLQWKGLDRDTKNLWLQIVTDVLIEYHKTLDKER